MNIQETKQAVEVILNNTKLVPLLMGQHGKGKSDVIRQYCEERNLQLIDLRLSTLEVGDFLGLPEFTRDRDGNVVATKFAKPDWFPTKGKGIIFLDELNRARKDMLQAAFQLALDKQIHTHKLPDGWLVVAACNPNTGDYVVTDMTDAAFVDRFAYIKFEPSVNEWASYAKEQGCSTELLDFINDQPEMLEDKGESFNLDFIKPSRRSMFELDKVKRSNVSRDLFRDIAYGVIGPVTTLAYLKHMDNNNLTLSLAEVQKMNKTTVEKIKRIVEKTRIDIINRVVDEFIATEKTPTKKELENIKAFIFMIPKEVGFKLLDGLVNKHEVLEETLFEDDEVCEFFKDSNVNAEQTTVST